MKKKYIMICIILLLALLYFQFLPIFAPDSSLYYSYLKIISGAEPMANWNILRGPSFPLYLYLITSLFGDNTTGILIGNFVLYLVLLYFSYKLLIEMKAKFFPQQNRKFVWILFLVFLVFNPISIGYSHAVLTESVAPSIAMITCYFSYKWYFIEFKENKIKYFLFSFLFSIIFIFMWFLKQPYLPIVFFIVFFTGLLSIFKKHTLYNIVQKSSTIIISLLLLFLSIIMWGIVINSNSKASSTQSYLANGIIEAISNYEKVPDELICNIEQLEKLNGKNKEKLMEIYLKERNCDSINIYNVRNLKYQIIDQKIILLNKDKNKVFQSLEFLLSEMLKHPILIADSYFRNYMSTIDIFETKITGNKYYATRKFKNVNNENRNLALVIYDKIPINWWGYSGQENAKITHPYLEDQVQFEKWNIPNQTLTDNIKKIYPLYLLSFKLLFLLLPILTIFSFVKFVKSKADNIYMLSTVLLASSLFHVLFHVMTGAIIDRYAYISYPMVVTGVLILFMKSEKQESMGGLKQEMSIKKLNDKPKILFVIPAYNEAENIEKVLKEIKKEIDYADILVINDCSTDDTKQIVEKNKVKCISNIYNMKYAMTVQTGIKYAHEKDYDFVVQFDADGQHIAKEAIKLIKKQKETNCNIVIGSRFLEKTNYPHSFFRKIGTKMFSWIIKIFCKVKITDPTSGFQILDRKVIEKYSKMGHYPEYPDANLIIEMLFAGYKIEECPVEMRIRENGESMHGGIIKPIKYMIKIFYTIIIIIIINFNKKEED